MNTTQRTVAAAVCVAGATAMGLGAAGLANAADSGIYAITTTASSATITLTPPPLNACSATLIVKGSGAAPASQADIAWTGSDQLLSYDAALANTDRLRGVAQAYPQYFTPRTVTVNLDPGTYTIVGGCTPYDANGEYAGDDTTETKTFDVRGSTTPGTGNGGGQSWGSLEGILPR